MRWFEIWYKYILWHVLYQNSNRSTVISRCGGTLLSNRHVLTSAKCAHDSDDLVWDADAIEVIIGEHNLDEGIAPNSRYGVSLITNDPSYTGPPNYNYDFSILTLSKMVSFTNEISPACLPWNLEEKYAGHVATVTGWGRLTPNNGPKAKTLQEVNVTVLTNLNCKNSWSASLIIK